MQRIAKFHKVSFEQFKADWADTFPDTPEEEIIHIYEGIRLPARATSGSAGYDFFTPVPLTLAPGENMKVPTGIRAEIDAGWVLQIFPRSSLGFKFRLQPVSYTHLGGAGKGAEDAHGGGGIFLHRGPGKGACGNIL